MYTLELKEVCEEIINVLYELRDKDIISEEELKIHSEKKLEFLEMFNGDNN